ncbi:MAG TPA: lysine--tRNA ligase [Candidatus Paceibacterota bacterium]
MYWADQVAEEAKGRYKDKIKAGKPVVIRDEKTASGRIHVGSLRGAAIHGVIGEALGEKNIANEFLWEINDFDVMDGLPGYLDEKTFRPHMGKLLCNVPSPDGKAKNFAEYFSKEFTEVVEEIGLKPKYYRSSEVYKSGKYNECIRKILDNAATIRKIYKEVSGADRDPSWLPLSVVCENCGKVGTTKATDWNGETVAYSCGKYVEWAVGCGHTGRVSPLNGKAKLPWKVEWPSKFVIFDVDIEGGGKDHSTKGGPRDIAEAISRQVFKREPPINVPYEWIYVGGKKMSSSKGTGSSAREMGDLLPPKILRFLLTHREPGKIVDFDPEGDTVPILFDTYDRFAKNYFSGGTDDFARAFYYSHPKLARADLKETALPRFSVVSFLAQMPHLDPVKEISRMEERKLANIDIEELNERIECAKRWLKLYAPPDFKFDIQGIMPADARNLSEIQKKALKTLLEFIESKQKLDGQEIHSRLHEMKVELSIEPRDLFEAIYISILGKPSGPKAGWFLSVLDRTFLIERLREASL